MSPDDLKQLDALGKANIVQPDADKADTLPAPPTMPVIAVTPSQHEALKLKEEFAERKAIKSREAELVARKTIVLNAIVIVLGLLAEVLREYLRRGHA